MAKFGKTLLAATALLSAAAANATVVVYTADAYNGDFAEGSQLLTISTWNISIPSGQSILSANFVSSLGNDNIPSTAPGSLSVGGITVATCALDGDCIDPISGSPAPINYTFTASQFASLLGSVNLVYSKIDCCAANLGASTLTITYGAPGGVPEPANWALMIAGFGLVGAAMRRRATAIA